MSVEGIGDRFLSKQTPLLERRGGCASNKMSRSHRRGADGVVAYTAWFCERPPRPLDTWGCALSRLRFAQRWLRDIFLMSRAPLLTRRGLFLVTTLVAALTLCLSLTALSHETLTTTVLFDREIVRILDKHCVMCHVENGPSFPLETYEQTWLQGRKIRAEAIARHMPPWAAIPGYGQFANDNSLTLRETQFLISWVEGLGPRNSGTVFTNVVDSSGKPRAAVRAQAHLDHWQLGQPSLTRQLSAETIDPAQGKQIKNNIIDLGLTSERRIRALEYIPGDRRVVRAVFFTVQETGQWIGSWTPWHNFMEWPTSVALRLPAGSHIQAEIH